ncbi:MAG: imidazole glycerol phosphate synthase subunit HisH [Fervidobacterium sp.]|uniref:imidazole glycerol phosphate synthase subunit HisH n=1 Tax=Fervidobacterium sp. TaxID=1871331 RepID=UPI00404B5D51
MLSVGIISVGPGNIMNLYRGVERALGLLQVTPEFKMFQPVIRLVDSADDIDEMFDVLFIPGVGHFAEGMRRLRESGLVSVIREHYENGCHVVGVCLGMQMLFEKSEEAPQIKGLSIIEGEIVKLKSQRIPHIGWNEVVFSEGFPSGYYYFVHSYRALCDDRFVIGKTEYDSEVYPSAARRGNVYGFQFHPEKSSKTGTKLLSNLFERVIRC